MEVLSLAEQDARALDVAEVKNPHVLFGLLSQEDSFAAKALETLGIEASGCTPPAALSAT
jgi:Clp amino terminal domain, pathogenicity island component